MRHHLHSVTIALRASKIQSTVGVGNPADRTFQIYQNPDTCKSWRSRSLQSYQNPGNFQRWRSLFHHLRIRHTLNYIIHSHVCVYQTVRNVGPPHLRFSFWWVSHLRSSVLVAFRATKILITLWVDVPVVIRPTKTLEGTMLPVNYRSWQRSFSELQKFCQQCELTFLSIGAFRATKVPTTLRADVSVASRAT